MYKIQSIQIENDVNFAIYDLLYLSIISFRIGFDGKLTVVEKLKGIYVTGQKIEETRKKILKAGKTVPIR